LQIIFNITGKIMSIFVIFLIPIIAASFIFFMDIYNLPNTSMEEHIITISYLIFLIFYIYIIYTQTKKLFNRIINHLLNLINTNCNSNNNYEAIGTSSLNEVHILLVYIDTITKLIYNKQVELEQRNKELLRLQQENEELLYFIKESSVLSLQNLEVLIKTRKMKNGNKNL